MAVCENNTPVTLSEKQEKLGAMRTCANFLCKHWPLVVAGGLALVGKLPALPLAAFCVLGDVLKNSKTENETLRTTVFAWTFLTGIGGCIIFQASLPSEDGKPYPFSAGYEFQNKAHDIVVGRIQDGADSAFKDLPYKNWLRFGHWTPVMETVHDEGKKECRNLDNTKLLMKVGGGMEGYIRPNKQSKWERVYDMNTFPYTEACGPH